MSTTDTYELCVAVAINHGLNILQTLHTGLKFSLKCKHCFLCFKLPDLSDYAHLLRIAFPIVK